MAVVSDPVVAADLDEILARDLPWEHLRGTSVLVTGASGMLPSYTVFTLLALNERCGAGITVYGLVRNEAKARSVLADVVDRPDFHFVTQDIGQPVHLEGDLDYVFHGASAARPSLHASDPVGTIRANLVGTFNLLDLCVAKRARGFVFMSSAEIYGAQPAGTRLIPETSYGGFDILNPRAAYSEGKRAAETVTAAYSAQYELSSWTVRFGHIYGPGMALDDGRVQADFAANLIEGRDIVLNSDGSAVRTYTYVGDAVAGMFTAMLRGKEIAYNVADPAGLISIRELAETFVRSRPELGLRLVFTSPDDARSYSPAKLSGLDSSRLIQLGWSPMVDLAAGIDRMVQSMSQGLSTR